MEINFTYLNMGLSLCLVCNLGAIRGRFRRGFGLVLFAVLLLHLKRSKAGDSRRASRTYRSIVSQRNAENRHRNTIFIKPRNFYIPFSLHSDRTAILVLENSKNIQLSAIFPCAGLLARSLRGLSQLSPAGGAFSSFFPSAA